MKHVLLIIMLLLVSLLAATPDYMPITTLAEDFGASWCTGCPIAWQGIDVVHSGAHNGEFISTRLYTESGDLSNPAVQSRFSYYEVIGVPSVIFNGKVQVNGSDVGIGDGSLYNQALNGFRFSSSPLWISLSNFNANSGAIAGNVEMVSPTENIINANLVYYLVENAVSATDTHVLRAVHSEDISISGGGTVLPFSHTFGISPTWNTANLWAIVFVQLANKAILQSVSSLPQPNYNFRAAMNWNNMSLTSDANTNFNSQPFWFYNLGAADNYTMRIVPDSAPDNWYFNYCDEEGNCYPGSADVPFSLSAAEMRNFHLNLSIGDPGIADFRVVISSPNIGSYSIPFHFYTTGMAADDPTLIPVPVQLGNIYPNPLSQNGTIEISSSKAIDGLHLEIFNLKGQKVQSQILEQLVPGENLISFRPGSDLPSGVYFYRLQGETSSPKKFILIR